MHVRKQSRGGTRRWDGSVVPEGPVKVRPVRWRECRIFRREQSLHPSHPSLQRSECAYAGQR